MHKLSREKLEAILMDIRNEPSWRDRANQEMDYYDGNQLDSKVLAQMEERGIAPLVRNLIGPTIDVVLGMEAKNKRDWKAVGDGPDDDNQDFAEALNVKLKEAERVSRADRACSDAYASQVKVGMGWVEIARESSPFRPPYRVDAVHRREIFWDWRAKKPDLSDARYLVRKQWHDMDVLELAFPQKAKLIRNSGWNTQPIWQNLSDYVDDNELAEIYDTTNGTSLEAEEWRDNDRKRLALFEVWYKAYTRGVIMRLPDGVVMEYDENNTFHQAAVASGKVQIENTIIPRTRLSWWLGPHQLYDMPTPYPHNYFPYVPFWGYKEDRRNIPYGLIRRMMSPQDEVNSRLSKMMWLLSSKRVIADSDATLWEHDRVMDEVARPDAYILLNENRKNKTSDAFRIEQDFQLSQQQFNVLQDASKAINDTAGVYQAMLGKEQHGVESGVAISSLVEQGATTLAEINDNYRYARRMVGELLLSLVKEDIGSEPTTVTVAFDGRRRDVQLNQQMVDPVSGRVYRSNDVARTRIRLELDEVPNTASYKAQQLMQLTEMTKSLPPELQTIIFDLVVKATDLPQRHEIADRLARATGQKPLNMTPEEEQEWQAQQQAAQEEAQVQMAELQAKVEKLQAEAEYYRARTEKTEAEADKLGEGMLLDAEQHDLSIESHQIDQAKKASEIDRNEADALAKLRPPPKPNTSTGTSTSKK